VLKSLPCDIFLGAHGDYYGLDKKFARYAAEGPKVFIDPDGYRAFVGEKDQAFRRELARQKRSTVTRKN
jgi:metallo-beta-lactamase class B